jgi:O-phosphoseryl-tRNA(Cys) synthetase
MKAKRSLGCAIIICGWFAASCLNAATIPAGTTLTVKTVSLVTSQNPVGRSFEAKLAQDISVKGNVALKAGTKVFGKIVSSRANPRKSGPLSVELASIDVSGRRIAVKTTSVEPGAGPQTARQARYGHTGGTTVVNPGSTMQFQLLQPVTF